jgi:succinate dehydrogenase / fumarate reductase, membrane anchor subunit
MAQAHTSQAVSAPKAGEHFWLWAAKQITGPLVFFLIIIHFVVNHLVAETGLLMHHQVVEYYQFWLIPIMEAIFLILVVSHSLLGVRSILLDLKPARSTLRIIDVVLLVGGSVAIVYGIWLIGAIVALGR